MLIMVHSKSKLLNQFTDVKEITCGFELDMSSQSCHIEQKNKKNGIKIGNLENVYIETTTETNASFGLIGSSVEFFAENAICEVKKEKGKRILICKV